MKAVDIPSKRTVTCVDAHVKKYGTRASAQHFGVHHSALKRVAAGRAVSLQTLSAINAKLKTEDDFKVTAISTPKASKKPTLAWPLDAIRAARDAQLAGQFGRAAALGIAMRLDDAIFVAHYNRTAPIGSLNITIEAAPTTRGANVAKKARDLINVPRPVLLSLVSTLVIHGVAFGQVIRETLDDGVSIAMTVREWPIEFVKWDDKQQAYVTQVEDGEDVVIEHGNGEWIVFAKQDTMPHQNEACILPGALIFASHIDAVRSWNAASVSHGQAKLIGELPEGVPLQADGGGLSPEAASFLEMLTDVVSGESGAGIRPAGSKTDFVANGSSAWQVFSELLLNREKAAARVWLGTDGILGSVGGAPGVDIQTLFGVATTKMQGDVDALERGLFEGLFIPWTALHYGDARFAPRLRFEVPDADMAQRNEQKRAARAAFFEALRDLKANGLVVDQETIDDLAADYGVNPPMLSEAVVTTSIVLAPTDVAKVVRVSEARASQGLPPFGDERDNMTLTELDESIKAASAAKLAAQEAKIEDVGSNQGTSDTSGTDNSGAAPEQTTDGQ